MLSERNNTTLHPEKEQIVFPRPRGAGCTRPFFVPLIVGGHLCDGDPNWHTVSLLSWEDIFVTVPPAGTLHAKQIVIPQTAIASLIQRLCMEFLLVSGEWHLFKLERRKTRRRRTMRKKEQVEHEEGRNGEEEEEEEEEDQQQQQHQQQQQRKQQQ